ncbi:unnamed protein product [Linum tenue]|uniref:OVATE domain-containing protein n=2 Tax=Linum tenue TaxID=586396 RepID=A0AAV0IT33_9ROSI|nr:unnamed protein product [Linum tenue]
MKALVAFRTKLLTPCRKFLRIFRLKLRKPLSIKPLKALRSARPHRRRSVTSAPPKPPTSFLSLFRRRHRKMDRVMELRSIVSEAEPRDRRNLLTSPVTPAYIKALRSGSRFGDETVEDACRSFENYLVEMIVEEGKMRDLMDVEDLLYCWKSLKCPVFIDLVCTFYGELCKDLFAPDHDEIEIHTTSSSG